MRDGWVETTLGDLANLQMGRTPSRRNSEYWTDDTKFPFCTIADMSTKRINPKREGVTKKAILDGKAKCAKAGTLLMSFKLTIGRMGFASVDLYPNEAIVMIENNPLIVSKEFLYFKLGSMDLTENAGRAVKGSTLNSASIAAIKLSLPPLAEQKRIVDLISSVDSYIEALQQQVDKARKSRNAVLHELLTKGGHGWVEKPIKELTEIRYGYTESANTENIGPKFLRITDIQEGKVEWDKVPFCIIRDKDLKLHKLQHGDLVFARTGATTGKSYLIQKPPEAVCASYLIRMRPLEEKVDSHFLSFFFQSICYWEQLLSRKSGSAQGGVNASKLGQLKINLPPLAEQKRIGEIISVFDNQIEALDSTITKSQNLRSALLSDLLSGNHEIPTTYDKLIGAA